jgi:hypothetical protein
MSRRWLVLLAGEVSRLRAIGSRSCQCPAGGQAARWDDTRGRPFGPAPARRPQVLRRTLKPTAATAVKMPQPPPRDRPGEALGEPFTGVRGPLTDDAGPAPRATPGVLGRPSAPALSYQAPIGGRGVPARRVASDAGTPSRRMRASASSLPRPPRCGQGRAGAAAAAQAAPRRWRPGRFPRWGR